jgi:hypothetical protein
MDPSVLQPHWWIWVLPFLSFTQSTFGSPLTPWTNTKLVSLWHAGAETHSGYVPEGSSCCADGGQSKYVFSLLTRTLLCTQAHTFIHTYVYIYLVKSYILVDPRRMLEECKNKWCRHLQIYQQNINTIHYFKLFVKEIISCR